MASPIPSQPDKKKPAKVAMAGKERIGEKQTPPTVKVQPVLKKQSVVQEFKRKPGPKSPPSATAFHDEAFKAWLSEKLTMEQVGQRFGVSTDAASAWRKKEGWFKLRDAIVKKAQGKLVEKESDKLARATSRQISISRMFQRSIYKALQEGTIQIDPMTGKFYAVQGTDGGVLPERRELLPGELNQVAQAFEKVAKLEWERLGGATAPASSLDVRFPDLVALLEKIDLGRGRGTVVEGTVVSREPPALLGSVSDPRESM